MNEEMEKIKELLQREQEVLIFGHKDADGDTLGCSLAFAEALRNQGKKVSVHIPEPLPLPYAWLPGFETINATMPSKTTGLVFFFDAANIDRSGTAVDRIASHALKVNIDHHESNTRYGDVNLITSDASAVGQMVIDLFDHLGWGITPSIATNLYVAIMTDTGGFRHDNTTAEVLADCARLAEAGADAGHIAGMVYKSRTPSSVKLGGLSMAVMQQDLDGKIVWSKVTRKMLHEAQTVMSESETIIDMLQSIGGIEIAVIFKEIRDDVTKISVRTRELVDASALCAKFGGGGHVRSSGAEVKLPLDQAITAVLAAAREAVLALH